MKTFVKVLAVLLTPLYPLIVVSEAVIELAQYCYDGVHRRLHLLFDL